MAKYWCFLVSFFEFHVSQQWWFPIIMNNPSYLAFKKATFQRKEGIWKKMFFFIWPCWRENDGLVGGKMMALLEGTWWSINVRNSFFTYIYNALIYHGTSDRWSPYSRTGPLSLVGVYMWAPLKVIPLARNLSFAKLWWGIMQSPL